MQTHVGPSLPRNADLCDKQTCEDRVMDALDNGGIVRVVEDHQLGEEPLTLAVLVERHESGQCVEATGIFVSLVAQEGN